MGLREELETLVNQGQLVPLELQGVRDRLVLLETQVRQEHQGELVLLELEVYQGQQVHKDHRAV